MKLKCVLDEGAYIPEKAHDTDAGFDLRTPVDFSVSGAIQYLFNQDIKIGMIIVDTGVHIEIPKGYVGMIKTKSGINTKRNILTEGVVDAGYTGSIKVKMYNFGSKEQLFKAGDKITQLVIIPIHEANEFEVVDSLEDTERGTGGFGSTGR